MEVLYGAELRGCLGTSTVFAASRCRGGYSAALLSTSNPEIKTDAVVVLRSVNWTTGTFGEVPGSDILGKPPAVPLQHGGAGAREAWRQH
jgi:hypothetical protein